MIRGELSKPGCIEYGVAERPLAGEPFSGDAHLVKRRDNDVLMAVVDGIGHGREAANAATAAVAVLEVHLDEPLVQLIERCHRVLVAGRGVAMTVIVVESRSNQLSWLGVGNVWGGILVTEGQARRWKSLYLHNGIVGYHLPRLHLSRMAIAPGDWLMLATDGVRADFDREFTMNGPPEKVATRILSRYVKGTDDALVLAARYQGKGYE